MENLFPISIGCLYIFLGLIGLLLNTTTCLMIWTKRQYRLSAYFLMANVALADSLMMIVAGIGCGFSILHSNVYTKDLALVIKTDYQSNQVLLDSTKSFIKSTDPSMNGTANKIFKKEWINYRPNSYPKRSITRIQNGINSKFYEPKRFRRDGGGFWDAGTYVDGSKKRKCKKLKFKDPSNYRKCKRNIIFQHTPDKLLTSPPENWEANFQIANFIERLMAILGFLEISAWTAGVLSYAFLGLNRCVAICFYGTKAKRFNRVTIALFSTIFTWVFGILIGIFYFLKHTETLACVGTFPSPLVGFRVDMWTISFLTTTGFRPGISRNN